MSEQEDRRTQAEPHAGLALEDRELLAAFAQGLTQQEVVREMHVSRRTLVRRMGDIRAALDVETNVEAVVAAVRRGLI